MMIYFEFNDDDDDIAADFHDLFICFDDDYYNYIVMTIIVMVTIMR